MALATAFIKLILIITLFSNSCFDRAAEAYPFLAYMGLVALVPCVAFDVVWYADIWIPLLCRVLKLLMLLAENNTVHVFEVGSSVQHQKESCSVALAFLPIHVT